MAASHPSLPAGGANFDPILKLLNSKAKNDGWNPTLIAALRSVAIGRQYPQQRCFHAGWVTHRRCIFCLHTAVPQQQHVATMPPLNRKELTDRDPANHRPTAPGATDHPHHAAATAAEQPPYETATDEQILATTVGTLAHKNYVCPSLRAERSKHASPRLINRAATIKEGRGPSTKLSPM